LSRFSGKDEHSDETHRVALAVGAVGVVAKNANGVGVRLFETPIRVSSQETITIKNGRRVRS
jgi:hypothetical protein